MIEDTGVTIAFWVLAITTLAGALGVMAAGNLLHAMLFLVLSFIGVAGLYITLSADFVAITQVLIYAGAIAILMIFAIMLTPRAARDNADGPFQGPAVVLGGLIAAVLVLVIAGTEWTVVQREGFGSTAEAIGEALLDKYILPFEIAGVLLLVAMIGAIVFVREE